MTRKDFVLIADTLCAATEREDIKPWCIESVANAFADKLELENTSFNRKRFIEACVPESQVGWRRDTEKRRKLQRVVKGAR